MTANPTQLAPSPLLADMAAQFTELARAMTDGHAAGLQPNHVVDFAIRSVPGAAHAAISMVRGGARPKTIASTDDLAFRVDALQYDSGEGPCMQALAESDVVLANNLSEDQRWPRFAPQAVSVTGVRSMLSLRLFLTRDRQGALNFYAAEPEAFEAEAIPLAAIFASYTSLTLLNIVHKKEIFDLERALQSNREIGVAMGILMAREMCTQSQAFNRLRTASQQLNRKLRDIADDVKRTSQLPVRTPFRQRRRTA